MKKMVANLFLMMVMFVFMAIPVHAAVPNTDLSTAEIRALEETGKLPGMVLTSKEEIKLDDTYEAVMETYEEPEGLARASRIKSASRTYRINNNKKGTVAVMFVLYGKFRYTGTTGTCINAYVNATNYEQANFNIVNESSVKSGDTAIGYCYALFRRTGKQWGKTMKIRISPTGVITFP